MDSTGIEKLKLHIKETGYLVNPSSKKLKANLDSVPAFSLN